MWTSIQNFRAGQYSDEGYGSGDSTHPSSAQQEHSRLEVFHQLGLLYARGHDKLPEDINSQEGWLNSNYVLVRNVHDDSLWVLWRKYVYYPDTNVYDLAKDIWPYPYAIFLGLDNETVICAKLAESWTALDPGIDTRLRLQRVLQARSARSLIDEPVLVSALRTAEGGIRRENDFRSKGLRVTAGGNYIGLTLI